MKKDGQAVPIFHGIPVLSRLTSGRVPVCLAAVVLLVALISLMFLTHGFTSSFRKTFTICGGYRIDGETYEMLSGRYQTDDLIMAADERNLALFELGHGKGLTDFYNMQGFYQSLEKENAAREKAIRNGETVFGLTRFSETDYLDYVISNLTLKLPGLLDGEAYTVSEDDARAFYERNKDDLFRTVDRVKISFIELSADDSRSISDVSARIESGDDFESIREIYGGLNLTIKENTIMYSRYKELYELAAAQELGQVAGPVALNGRVVFYRCDTILPGGVLPYKDVSESAREYVRKEKFETLIQNLK